MEFAGQLTTAFISYAREDRRHADRLYADLRSNSIDAWLDSRSLQPGQDWKREIRRAIKASAFVVLLLSEYSVTKFGFEQAEIKEAIEESRSVSTGNVFILPARLSDVRPADDELLDLNWVDLFPSYDKGVAKILDMLKDLSGAPLEYGSSSTRSPVEYAYCRSFEGYLQDFLEKLPASSSGADRDYAVWLTSDSRDEVTFPPEPIPARIFGSVGIQEDRTWPGSVIRLRRSSTSCVRRRSNSARARRSLRCASCWA